MDGAGFPFPPMPPRLDGGRSDRNAPTPAGAANQPVANPSSGNDLPVNHHMPVNMNFQVHGDNNMNMSVYGANYGLANQLHQNHAAINQFRDNNTQNNHAAVDNLLQQSSHQNNAADRPQQGQEHPLTTHIRNQIKTEEGHDDSIVDTLGSIADVRHWLVHYNAACQKPTSRRKHSAPDLPRTDEERRPFVLDIIRSIKDYREILDRPLWDKKKEAYVDSTAVQRVRAFTNDEICAIAHLILDDAIEVTQLAVQGKVAAVGGKWDGVESHLEWYHCFQDRLYNITEALRRSKVVVFDCRGEVSFHRKQLVMHPRAYLKRKHTNQNGNVKKGSDIKAGQKAKGKAVSDEDPVDPPEFSTEKWKHYKPSSEYTKLILDGYTRDKVTGEFKKLSDLGISRKRAAQDDEEASGEVHASKRVRSENTSTVSQD